MILEGKAFIVTGGAGSIGGQVCRDIIAKGGIALVFDIVPDDVGDAKAKEYSADRAFYFKTDISDADTFSSTCKEALKVIPKGSLFGGVHCAAIAPGRPWDHKLINSVATFEKVLKVNVLGTFVVDSAIGDAINSQYPDEGPFAPRVTEERGAIVNIASIVAKPVPARCLTYGASKTAVLGITEGMADFLGPYGIRVNSISPAVVASAMMGPDRVPHFEAEMKAACIFPHRVTQPAEISHAILFLLENSMMNDFHLRVDGGWRGSSNWGSPKDPRQNSSSLE